MLVVLSRMEQELPMLLRDGNWESLDITYEDPHVERLWRDWGDYRINLHRIYPCDQSSAFKHHHPWPSAIRVLSGNYEMGVGYDNCSAASLVGSSLSSLSCTMVVKDGGFAYEMVDPNAWHYVRPIDAPSYSVMITGKPYPKYVESKAPSTIEDIIKEVLRKQPKPLSDTIKTQLLVYFFKAYPILQASE